jgi:hypothetical protein
MLVPSFPLNVLERICDVLADTSTGFTGSEIGKLLTRLNIADPLPQMTKRVRLYEALRQRQGCGPLRQSCCRLHPGIHESRPEHRSRGMVRFQARRT